jgi:peptidylprolyl isomerase
MKNLFIVFITLLFFGANAQTSKEMKAYAKRAKALGFTEKGIMFTKSGLMYKYNFDAPGRQAVLNDVIELQFVLRNSKDSVLRNTFDEGNPVISTLQKPRFMGSFEEGLALMSAGDSCTFWINADSMFAKGIGAAMPAFIEKGSLLRFDVKMNNVWSMEEYLKARELRKIEAQLKEDRFLLDYFSKNDIQVAQVGETGIYYQQLTPGNGTHPQKGQQVKVHYTGKLINGKVFDSSVTRGEPFVFTVGVGQVIEGWDFGIPNMTVGEKGILYIPSYRGYGDRGAGASIPPDAILIFEVELIDIL